MSNTKRALIIGAGITGLATALTLSRRGWSVKVFERASAFEAVGAGIQLAPNGMKVLRALGLEGEILNRGFLPEALEMRLGKSGRRVFSIPVRHVAPYRWRAPYVHIHRADLVAVLADALLTAAPDALRLGASVQTVDETKGAIRLSDGSEEGGDLVVAADGFRSGVRAQLFDDPPPRDTGMIAWRAVVPAQRLGRDTPPETACVWAGPGRHAVTYHLSKAGLVNFVGIVERQVAHSEQYERWDAEGARQEALADFAGWQPEVTTLIERADSLGRWTMFDRPPNRAWVSGCAVLAGDAAHPMLPTMAQGGCQGLEDAWALAACLGSGDSFRDTAALSAALQRFMALRQPRTEEIQRRATRNARDFHHRSGAEALRAYSMMWLGGNLLPWAARARLDPIYGYDITAEAPSGPAA